MDWQHTHPRHHNQPSMDAPLDDLDKAIEPQRLLRLWGKLLLVILLIIAMITISCIAWKHSQQLDESVEKSLQHHAVKAYPREWFVGKMQEIDGYKHQLKTARAALAAIEEQRKSTWISRESDREVFNRTLDHVLTLEGKLSAALNEYNTALAAANSADIAGLTSQATFD